MLIGFYELCCYTRYTRLVRFKPPQIEIKLPDMFPAATVEWEPTLAWGKSHYLAVWRDTRNGNNDIYAARYR
jgi:hypothetical protein